MPTFDAGQSGLVGTIGVTVLNPDGTEHTARTTAGVTEPVAGSGVYHLASPGTDLTLVWDMGVGTIGASATTDPGVAEIKMVTDDLAGALPKLPHQDTVWGGGYPPIPVGLADWGIGANTSRYYLNANNNSRVWATGKLRQAQIRLELKHADLTAFYLMLWRKNGSGTYDLIGQEDVLDQLVAGTTATVTLAAPMDAQAGDFIGYGITASSVNAGYQSKLLAAQAAGSTYYVSNEVPGSAAYPWAAKTATTSMLPIRVFVDPAPVAVCIGDSLMAGHPANYSLAENSTARDATSDTAALLKAVLGVTNVVNMGIGGQTMTQVAARIGSDLVALRPKIAVLNIGADDVLTTTEAVFIAAWTDALDACEAAGIVPVCVPILPWTSGTTTQNQTRDAWNTVLKTLVLAYPQACYAEDALPMLGQFRAGGDAGNLWDIKAAYNADGIHLNAAGYAVLAQTVARALSRGRLTAADMDGVATEATAASGAASAATAALAAASADAKLDLKPTAAEIDAAMTAAHGAGSWGAAGPPNDWPVITHATLDDAGVALGPITLEGVARANVEVYAKVGTTTKGQATTNGAGHFSLAVPPGATYTIVCRDDGNTWTERTVTA